MDAYDFGKIVDRNLVYGASNENAVKALRKLADDIEKKQIYVETCKVTTQLSGGTEEFCFTVLELRLIETRKTQPDITLDKIMEIRAVTNMPVEAPPMDFLQSVEIAESLKYNH